MQLGQLLSPALKGHKVRPPTPAEIEAERRRILGEQHKNDMAVAAEKRRRAEQIERIRLAHAAQIEAARLKAGARWFVYSGPAGYVTRFSHKPEPRECEQTMLDGRGFVDARSALTAVKFR